MTRTLPKSMFFQLFTPKKPSRHLWLLFSHPIFDLPVDVTGSTFQSMYKTWPFLSTLHCFLPVSSYRWLSFSSVLFQYLPKWFSCVHPWPSHSLLQRPARTIYLNWKSEQVTPLPTTCSGPITHDKSQSSQ